MRRSRLFLGGIAALALVLSFAQADRIAAQLSAVAAPAALLDGCTDVPEAVALADTLRLRGIAIDRALADLDRRKQDLAAAEERIKIRLEALKSAKSALGDARTGKSDASAAGIEALEAVIG